MYYWRIICSFQTNFSFLFYLTNGEEVPQGLGHFFTVHINKAIMDPITYVAMCTCCATLCNFILMVWKHKIHSSTMYIKCWAQIRSTHSTTFNMPSRPTSTPWAIPRWLVKFGSL